MIDILNSAKKLGFGTMRLPLLDSEDTKSVNFALVSEMVDRFIERGFSYFDTAYGYHGELSETAVKRCLTDRYPRDKYILCDKMPIIRVKSGDEYPVYFDEQLRRCGVDYFDIYLLHNMCRERYINTQKFGGFDFLRGLKERGLAKYIGFSFHDDAELLDEILTAHPEVDIVQLQLNYLDWNSSVIQSGACYETALRHVKPVIAMEPVKGGSLASLPPEAEKLMKEYGTGGSPASYAIRFAASLENCAMVLSGMSDMDQMLDNTSYMADFKPLSGAEREMLGRVTEVINDKITPCTNCKYCTEECPKNINIPSYLGLLNMFTSTGKKSGMYYRRASLDRGRALDCVKCGKCEKACPQHIHIREELEKFAELYESDPN